MKILFLHGLESKLSNEKRAILETYGNVIAPDLDYKSNSNMIQTLYNEFQNQNIDVIIGSSMGGFTGFYLAKSFGIGALLYNPALPYRNSVIQEIPSDFSEKQSPLLRIVLGGRDDVVKAKDNLAFLSQNVSNLRDCTIEIVNDLAHQIPIDVFEEQTKNFFQQLCF